MMMNNHRSWSMKRIKKYQANDASYRRIWTGKRKLVYGSIYEIILFSDMNPQNINDFAINVLRQDQSSIDDENQVTINFRDVPTLMECLDDCENLFTTPLSVKITDYEYKVTNIFESNETGFTLRIEQEVEPGVHIPRHHIKWLIEMFVPFEQIYQNLYYCLQMPMLNRLDNVIKWFYCNKLEARERLSGKCDLQTMVKEGISDQDVEKLTSLGIFLGIDSSCMTIANIVKNIFIGMKSNPPKGKDELYDLVKMFCLFFCSELIVQDGKRFDSSKVF